MNLVKEGARETGQHIFIFLAILVAMILGAWMMQINLGLNRDASWLLEAGKRLLAGGSYSKDFFENNPPLILYLYLPAFFLTKYAHFSQTVSFQLYVFFLASLSFVGCCFLRPRTLIYQNPLLGKSFLFLLACTFFVMPTFEFGQREHLFYMLTMPYLFLVANRLQGDHFSFYFATFIGLMAGLGFGLKPYFLPTLLLIELYYCFVKRNLFVCFRPETFGIGSLLLIYLVSILIWQPDYFSVVVPFSLRWTYSSVSVSWFALLSNAAFVFSLIAILAYIIQAHYKVITSLDTILVLGCVGGLVSYLVQRTTFVYHILPALSFSLLLFLLFFTRLIVEPQLKKHFIVISSFFLLFAVFNHIILPFPNIIFDFHPLLFFAFFSGLLIFIMLFDTEIKLKYLEKGLITLFVIIAAYAINYMAHFYIVSEHFFSMTFLFIITAFSLLVCKFKKQKLHAPFIMMLGILIFLFPCIFIFCGYTQYANLSRDRLSLVNYLNKHALHRPVYFFTTEFINPIYNKSESIDSSRFSAFWMLPGLVKQLYLPGDVHYEQQMIDQNFLIEMVAEDLRIGKPYLVFIDDRSEKNNFSYTIEGRRERRPFSFDYLVFFQRNKNFKLVWEHYKYLTAIQKNRYSIFASSFRETVYKYKVYQRIE